MGWSHIFTRRYKTPIVLQMETGDCGAAALGIILGFYQCYPSLKTLRDICLASRDGVSLANLVKAARHFGLNANVCQQKQLSSTLKLPAILFWNRKHYIVLEKMTPSKVYINDPGKGRQVIDWILFNKKFSGIAIQLQKNETFKKFKPISLWRSELLPLISDQWRIFTCWCAGMLLLLLCNLSPLIFTKLFIDKIIVHRNAYQINLFLILMPTILVLQWAIAYGTRILFRLLETSLATRLSKKIIRHLVQLPLQFFIYRQPADLLSRVQAADRLVGTPWSTMCMLVTSVLQGGLSLGLIYCYSPLLSLTMLAIIAIYFGVMTCCQRMEQTNISAAKQKMGELSQLTTTCIVLITQIKAQCAEAIYFSKWKTILQQYVGTYQRVSRQQQLLRSIHFLFFSTGYFSLLWLGFSLVYQNRLSLGEMMACQILFLSVGEVLAQQSQLTHYKEQIQSDLQNIHDITAYTYESSLTNMSLAIKKTPALGRIQICDISFGYSHEFTPLFHHLSLTVEPNSTIAIMGKSGCGKSTLVHLLSSFYQPWVGDIFIDHVSLRHYSDKERARFLGVVNQQHFFYQGSIQENLCLWEKTYTQEEMLSALRMACIDELVTQNKQGFDFQLTEGATNLSGGERQRLELARTLLAKPRILILDEAMSSLDRFVEKKIRRNLKHYSATKIFVAHKFSHVDDIDALFVLQDGKLHKAKESSALYLSF